MLVFNSLVNVAFSASDAESVIESSTTFAEIPTTKDIWNDYMQSESEEVKRLGDNINNVVLKFQVKDNDGKETIDYYRMKPVYEYSIRKINIYKIKE